MNCAWSMTRWIAASTSGLIRWYWVDRSTIWMGFMGTERLMGGEDSGRFAGCLSLADVSFGIVPPRLPSRSMRLLASISLAFLLGGGPSYAQGDIRDTSIALVAVSPSYAYQIPSGVLADRFGPNSNIGISAHRKFKSNFFVGAEGSFLFGNKVHEPGLLRHVINRMGQIVDKEGVMADVHLYERGYTIMGVAGKIMPIAGPNPNSGIMLKVGAGYMRHKIRIQTQENEVPNLEGDYLEGYDRLSAGPALLFFVGYQHFGN